MNKSPFSLGRLLLPFLPAIALAGLLFALPEARAQDEEEADTLRITPQSGDEEPIQVKQPPSLDIEPAKSLINPGDSVLEVFAQESVSFDADSRKAVFKGDVKAVHPTFQMRTNSLTVTIKKGGGGIETAEASGRVLFVYQDPDQKDPDTGEPIKSMGKAGRAVLNMDSGQVKLYGYPQLQQGANLIVGTSSSTVITLSRDGKHRINGPSKTQILDRGGAISRP